MFRRKVKTIAIGASTLGLVATGTSLAGTAGATVRPLASKATAGVPICAVPGLKTPTYKHIILIIEENHSYNSIIGPKTGAPYINGLAKACGLATSFHNITHPSLPNYIALTSATDYLKLKPFERDCNPGGRCLSSSQSLFSQVATKGGWKSYQESMPSPCYGTTSGTYAPKHNPAVYYTNISKAKCQANDVPLGTFSSSPLLKDFSKDATAPALAVVTPNLNDDMHDGTIAQGDNWLKKWMARLTATAAYKAHDTAIFIIWDEGEGPDYTINEDCRTSTMVSCHVAALVVAPSVPAHSVSTVFTDYSFVRTVEDLLGLAPLNDAATAPSMVSAFNL